MIQLKNNAEFTSKNYKLLVKINVGKKFKSISLKRLNKVQEVNTRVYIAKK